MLKNSKLPSSKAKRSNLFLIFGIHVFLIINIGCGKKPKNILSFDTNDKRHKKSKRIFHPTVKNATITSTNLGIELSWKPIEHEQLEGYNVYRFSHTKFIPKNPLNKTPLTTTTFIDSKPSKTYTPHYVIRAVFKKEKMTLEGPTSQIIFAH